MKDMVIIGAGGLAREVAWLVERINNNKAEWKLLGFLDVDKNFHGKMLNGYPILGGDNWLEKSEDNIYVICAIGNPLLKESIVKRIKQDYHVRFATLVDPQILLSPTTVIGEGTILCANTFISVNVKIGDHVLTDTNCTIAHDAEICDFCTIHPGVKVSGNVRIDKSSEIGTGSQIIQGLSIGTNSIVGAGSVVVRSLPDKCTAVGVPAKVIKYQKDVNA